MGFHHKCPSKTLQLDLPMVASPFNITGRFGPKNSTSLSLTNNKTLILNDSSFNVKQVVYSLSFIIIETLTMEAIISHLSIIRYANAIHSFTWYSKIDKVPGDITSLFWKLLIEHLKVGITLLLLSIFLLLLWRGASFEFHSCWFFITISRTVPFYFRRCEQLYAIEVKPLHRSQTIVTGLHKRLLAAVMSFFFDSFACSVWILGLISLLLRWSILPFSKSIL